MKYTSDDVRIRFWKDQDGICPLCERPILDPLNRDRDDPEACNVDHKIPQAHGGTDVRSNLQLTHIPCNGAKGCGCPNNSHKRKKVVDDQYRHQVWRRQGFKCALCGKTVTPSEIKLVDDAVSHPECLRTKYQGV